jgi:hypothetical protein
LKGASIDADFGSMPLARRCNCVAVMELAQDGWLNAVFCPTCQCQPAKIFLFTELLN